MSGLYWLPEADNWRTRLQAVIRGQGNAADEVWALARSRLNFVQLNALDAAVQSRFAARPHDRLASRSVRLAVLSSSTATHLHSAIRVAGLRWGIWIETYECAYGQYRQELIERGNLHSFNPTHVLLALDAEHLTAGLETARSAAEIGRLRAAKIEDVRRLWDQARSYGWTVIQQTPLPCHPTLLGLNEHRLPGSRSAFVAEFNHDLRAAADAEGIDLLAVDARAGRDGLAAWHSPALWHSAKQEISPTASPVYGDLVARLLAARLGCTYKCLALDLDNTLWGGVVGDDGMDRLVLGQGSGLGEAFAAFQRYVRELSRRGVIVAICSKNDEVNAREAFERHPEMVLRPQDVAFFVANWNDKATNVQAIADSLRIGVDSVVFVDDNPFERNLVREKLPRAAVPEISDDPTGYPQVLADAGYFESVCVTDDDRARSAQYQANRQRQVIQSDSGDISSFLEGLSMRLLWRRFDSAGLARIVQLINKTNQFNLTTRRYSEAEVLAVMRDEGAIGLQLRLLDRFGDNGMIAVVIGRLDDGALRIDSWLMSCRVLGRQVEQATLNVIARQAARLGAKRLLGEYLPTAKNGMVREHYRRLGFTMVASDVEGGSTWVRELTDFVPADTCIEVVEG